jgi:hypothetical protein
LVFDDVVMENQYINILRWLPAQVTQVDFAQPLVDVVNVPALFCSEHDAAAAQNWPGRCLSGATNGWPTRSWPMALTRPAYRICIGNWPLPVLFSPGVPASDRSGLLLTRLELAGRQLRDGVIAALYGSVRWLQC